MTARPRPQAPAPSRPAPELAVRRGAACTSVVDAVVRRVRVHSVVRFRWALWVSWACPV